MDLIILRYFPKKRPPQYLAEFFCRHSSCKMFAHVRIECSQSFVVTLEFLVLQKCGETQNKDQIKKSDPECPYIYFVSHDEFVTSKVYRSIALVFLECLFTEFDCGQMAGRLFGEKSLLMVLTVSFFLIDQLSIEKRYFKERAINSSVLRKVFVSKLIEGKDRLNGQREGKNRVVSTKDYIEVMQPILASVNSSCRFTVPLTECFVRGNKRTDDPEIRTLSVRFRCAVEGCPMRVTVHVSNPEGNVTLFFTKTRLYDGPSKEQDGKEYICAGLSPVIPFHNILRCLIDFGFVNVNVDFSFVRQW